MSRQHQGRIDASNACVQTCKECVNVCCTEGSRAECTRVYPDCAEVCTACVKLLSRGSQAAPAICGTCAELCDACATQCEKYPDMEACRRCAEACRRCAAECRKMAA